MVNSEYSVPQHFPVPTRASVINSISTHYSLNNLSPRSVEVHLPGIDKTVIHTISSFCHQLYSLLTDPRLQSDDCFIFSGETPFDFQGVTPENLPEDHVYLDINTGQRFHQCWMNVCMGNDKYLLCPIIFYCDTTYTDSKGKLTLEPISFTLGIYNLATRNQPYAWRTIGFIPKVHFKGEYTSEQKIQDYHTSLRWILDEFIQCQKAGGISWQLTFKGKKYDVILQIPVLYIIGDTEGHDKMCARTGSNNQKSKRICRACDCSPLDADDPNYDCRYTNQQDAVTAYCNGDAETLAEMSLFNIRNTWWDVSFGGCARGIYGAVPGEVLHFLQQGLHQYLKKGLLEQKMILNETRKRKRQQKKNQQANAKQATKRGQKNKKNNSKRKEPPQSNETIYEPPATDEQSRLNVFNKLTNDVVEAYAEIMGFHLQRQSERQLPRSKFSQGITKNESMVKACEEQGILLLFMLFLSSTAGSTVLTDAKDALKGMGGERLSNYIGTLEHMILFEEFMKVTNGYDNPTLNMIDDFIPPLMERFKKTVDRQNGNQMRIIKFHLMLHVVDDIRRFGLPSNFSTGPSESRHKSHCKQPGSHTQRRSETFVQQVQTRYNEQLAIEMAANDPQYLNFDWRNQSEENYKATNMASNMELSCPVFRLHRDHWEPYSAKKHKSKFSKAWIPSEYRQVMDYLVHRLCCHLPEDQLPLIIYSECRVADATLDEGYHIYRTTPSYRSGPAWTDWAYTSLGVHQGDHEPVLDGFEEYDDNEIKYTAPFDRRFRSLEFMTRTRPTELFGFFFLPPLIQEIEINDVCILPCREESTKCFVGVPLKRNPIIAGATQHVATTIQYWSKKSDFLRIFPCERLESPCLVVPDYDAKINHNNTKYQLVETGSYTVIGPPAEWDCCFIDLASDYYMKVNENRPDTEEVDLTKYLKEETQV